MTHANSPAAVRAFVEACRYPFNRPASAGARRGPSAAAPGRPTPPRSGASSVPEYLEKADPWPLNPEGELLLGLKIENRHALQFAETLCADPGHRLRRVGPRRHGHVARLPGRPRPAVSRHEMTAARDRVFAATKAAGIAFLEAMTAENVTQKIDEGVRISSAGRGGPELAEIGRKHTKRTMPW